MALTLGQAETEVRALTRHELDTRVTSPQIVSWLNRVYRGLRAELQGIAPELYVTTSDEITFEDDEAGNEIVLSDANVNFDHILRVERRAPGDTRFFGIQGGSPISPNETVHGRVSFVIEHKCLKLSAPGGRTGGTYRVVSYVVPMQLSDANAYFQLPSQLELPLLYRTVGLVHLRDGDGPRAKKEWDDLADAEIERVTPALEAQGGIHPVTAGVGRVMGY